MKHWKAQEIEILETLRTRFLNRTAGEQDYWRSEQELALYDGSFAERIGWKWDAAIRGLHSVGWRPKSTRILDWGCGSGIASRRVLETWPGFLSCGFVDRSARAVQYAGRRLRETFPAVGINQQPADANTLLVISHVLNELPESELALLLAEVRAAGEVIWVEAGTHADSRRLIEVRERILAEPAPPRIVAPCTHGARCGLLAPANAPHWCHHFAKPPVSVFQDARWAEWSRALGIDLRALPYSHLVLTRHDFPGNEGVSRVLGGLRESKGYCRVLNCDAVGVRDLMLQKRDAGDLYRLLTKRDEWPLFAWEIAGEKIAGGRVVDRSEEALPG